MVSANDLTQMDVLLLNRRDAARALSISERKLFTLTQAGTIPCVRLGNSVRYRRATLEEVLKELEGHGTQRPPTADPTQEVYSQLKEQL